VEGGQGFSRCIVRQVELDRKGDVLQRERKTPSGEQSEPGICMEHRGKKTKILF